MSVVQSQVFRDHIEQSNYLEQYSSRLYSKKINKKKEQQCLSTTKTFLL